MGLMGTAVAILGVFAAVFVTVISRLIGDDVKAWMPKLAERFIVRAVRKLPSEERQRFAEEWRSVVNDTPGDISKLIVAFGFVRASGAMARSIAMSERFLAGLLLLLIIPVASAIVISIKVLGGQGPIFARQKRLLATGKIVDVWKFRTSKIPFPVGRFLRQSSLDELPILLNVIRGDLGLGKNGQQLTLEDVFGFFRKK